MANPSMIFVVSARDDASKTIEQINRQIANVGKNAGGGAGGKGFDLPGFDLGKLTSSIQQMGSAGGALGVLGDLIPIAGLGVAASAIGAVTWQLGEAGAQTLRTRGAFEQLATSAGTTGQAMLTAMQEASRGTIADADLMAAANRALVLGVASSAEEMGRLTEAAIARGRQVGVGATQAISDLVTGIGRMSPEILDNLGIANAKAAFDTYAVSLGTTADKLTDIQKKQALVNAVLADAQGVTVVDDAAASFERMNAAIQNAKDALGIMFAPAVAVIAENLAKAAQQVTGEVTKTQQAAAQADLAAYGDSITKVAAEYEKWANVMAVAQVGSDTAGMSQAMTQMQMYGEVLANIAVDYNNAARVTGAPLLDVDQLRQGVVAFVEMDTAIRSTTPAANENAAAIANVKRQLAELAGQANVTGPALQSAFIGMAQVLGAAGALTGLRDKQKELIGLQQAWNYMGLSAEEIQFREAEWLQQTNAGLASQRTEWEKLTGGIQAHSAGISDAERAYDSLLGKVKSVLQSALDPGVGVNVDDILPREDAVNENARRLAAIAKEGLTGQDWMGDFAKEAPGAYADLMLKIAEGMDAKTAAAGILRDFQDGLRPDLIDKDRAKDMIRRTILGDQSMSQLAQEIAAELSAELGVPLQQAQDAAAGVLGTGKGKTGANEGDGFATGFSGATNGAALVTTITTQMTQAYTEFDKAGTAAGGRWAGTFYTAVETNMAPALVNLLVTLVTPGVLALIQSQTSTTTPPA